MGDGGHSTLCLDATRRNSRRSSGQAVSIVRSEQAHPTVPLAVGCAPCGRSVGRRVNAQGWFASDAFRSRSPSDGRYGLRLGSMSASVAYGSQVRRSFRAKKPRQPVPRACLECTLEHTKKFWLVCRIARSAPRVRALGPALYAGA
jgi:hypothetical protein